MKNGQKRFQIFLFIGALFLIFSSCELNRQINDAQGYPILGPLNITNGSAVGNYFTINGTAYHASGINSIELFITDLSNNQLLTRNLTFTPGKLVSFQATITLTNYSTYSLTISARNNLGVTTNSEPIMVSYFYQGSSDLTPPVLTLMSPSNHQTVGASYQLQGYSSDNQSGVSGVFFKFDNSPFYKLALQSSNFTTNIKPVTPGWHTNYLYAVDGVGNTTTTNKTAVYYQSGTPWISIDSPANGTYFNYSTILLRGQAGVDNSGLANLSLKLNNNSYNTISLQTNWSNTVNLTSGTNRITVRVIASNTLTNTTPEWRLYFDTARPLVSITSHTNHSVITTTSFILYGTASDLFSGLDGIYLAVDDYNFNFISSLSSWSKNITLPFGTHDLHILAKDKAGNISLTNDLNILVTNLTLIDTTMTIYYYNYNNWTTPKIYAWSGSWQPAGTWSGTAMSNTGNKWYSHTFNTNMLLNIIFSDNGANQSDNLSHHGTGWYKLGKWYDVNPDWMPSTWAAPAGGYFTNSSITVRLGTAGTNILFAKYTLDGSLPGPAHGTSYSSNSTFSLGSGMTLGQHKTLKLWVSNTYGEQRQAYEFIKTNALPHTSFRWENATIYFVFIDRFYDGNNGNNTSYGREWDSAHSTAGEFMGGDLAGLTQKLNEGYFTNLGINAIWITCPFEQMHGWVEGGSGAFKHYGYHGYYIQDWTRLDANFGTTNELRTFIDTAHSQGIRVMFDTVINHGAYAPIYDLNEYSINVLLPGWEYAVPGQFHQYIDYTSPNWVNWWGTQWIRAALPGYDQPGYGDPLKDSLLGLPDFKTESTSPPTSLPLFYAHKTDTGAVFHSGWTVRKYLINWICDWVREYGIDGFRCDTAKHVEIEGWVDLKTNAVAALRQWKANNPSKKLDDLDLWMTGEHWNWGKNGITKTWDDPEYPGVYNKYIPSGAFDSMINFDIQSLLGDKINQSYNSIDGIYSSYATSINGDPTFNVLSYLSSHDTVLFYQGGNNNTVNTSGSQSDPNKHKKTANYFFCLPGAIQVFYGDEVGRTYSTAPVGSDWNQKTRSFMPWSLSADQTSILNHWRILGQFRNRHLSIGAGQHSKISDSPYIFKRSYAVGTSDEDIVVIAMGVSGFTTINVSSIFPDGTKLRDYYTKTTNTVSSGQISFTPGSDILLIEKIQ